MDGSNEKSKEHPGKIDAQSIVIKALAEKKTLNMYEIKEQQDLFYSTVHKAINSLKKQGLVAPLKSQITEKGVIATLFSLTFQGFIRYLASQPELWNPNEFGPIREAEALKKKQEKKRKEFYNLLGITESYGELLNYAIFKEIRWLTEHYGPNLLHDVVDVARTVEASGGMELLERYQTKQTKDTKEKQKMLRAAELQRKVKTCIVVDGKTTETSYYDPLAAVDQKIQNDEQCVEILLRKQSDWWKRLFAVRLAERILASPAKGDMHNEALFLLFKQVADNIRKFEVEPIENIAEIFRTGDAKAALNRLMGGLNEKSPNGSVDSNA